MRTETNRSRSNITQKYASMGFYLLLLIFFWITSIYGEICKKIHFAPFTSLTNHIKNTYTQLTLFLKSFMNEKQLYQFFCSYDSFGSILTFLLLTFWQLDFTYKTCTYIILDFHIIKIEIPSKPCSIKKSTT